MKIQQAYVGVKFFKDTFLKKYGLKEYKNSHNPAVFFGLYRKQQHYLLEHRSFAVIVWAGSDAIQLKSTPDFVDYMKRKKDLFHIAISNFIEKDLQELGIPYHSIPITPHSNDDIKPERLGRYIFMYTSTTNTQVYGTKYLTYIKQKLPGIKIILATKNTYTREELIKVYKKCFLGLRLTKHDGLSNTVSELGLMGRKVVWNGNTPNAINYRNVDDIVRIIENESRNIGRFTPKVATKVKSYLEFRDDWLETDSYKGIKFPKKETKAIKEIPEKYKASVIINTYNDKPEDLRRAIDSYLRQMGVEKQIILSTVKGDNSIQIAKEYKGIDLCVSDKPGIYTQLNKALGYIKNTWVTYASGNDIGYKTKLHDEISMCMKHKKFVCYSAFDVTCYGNTKTRYFHNYSLDKHLKGNFVNDCAMVHKSLIDKYGPFKLEWGNYAYYDFWLRIYKGEGNVFIYNPKPTWNYIVSDDALHIKRKKDPKLTKQYEDLKQKMIESHARVKEHILR